MNPTGSATRTSRVAIAPISLPLGHIAGCPAPQTLFSLPSSSKTVALTFDDGPDPVTTPNILSVLAKEGVHGTFFDTGEHAAAHPNLVRAEEAGGNAVGNHTWDHPQLTKLSDTAISSELARTQSVLTGILGHTPCFMRPPYGDINARVNADIRAQGYTEVMWDVDTVDWSRPGVAKIESRATAFRNGASPIILMHAGKADPYAGSADRSQTVSALPTIIETLKARGYSFVQVNGFAF